MIRRLTALAAGLLLASGLTLATSPTAQAAGDAAGTYTVADDGTPATTVETASAAVANTWADSIVASKTYYVQSQTTHVNFAKLVITVQFFFTQAGTNLYTVSAVRTRCAARNLDGATISGITIGDCTLFQSGRTAYLTNNPTDAGQSGCCANSTSPLRYAHYDALNGVAFYGRAMFAWRSATTGTVYTSTLGCGATGHDWIYG